MQVNYDVMDEMVARAQHLLFCLPQDWAWRISISAAKPTQLLLCYKHQLFIPLLYSIYNDPSLFYPGFLIPAALNYWKSFLSTRAENVNGRGDN